MGGRVLDILTNTATSTRSKMGIRIRLPGTLTTPMLTESVITATSSLKPSVWVSSACSNIAFTEEMSGSKSAKKRRGKSKNQTKIQAGIMFMTTATCTPTWTPTKPLLVTLQVLFANYYAFLDVN